MALYEYKCPNCRHKFEQIQKMKDRETGICTKCGCVSPLIPSTIGRYKIKGQEFQKVRAQ